MTGTVRAVWSVVTTTATGLGLTSITRMTAVRNLPQSSVLLLHQYRARAQFPHSPDQVRGVLEGTTMAGDVALRSSPVMKARETVMVLGTGGNTMATLAARET